MVNGMKWFQKKKGKKEPLKFGDAARFNWALDMNRELQDGMAKLAEEFPNLTEESYTQKALELFRKAGLELSAEDLKMLLALRQETDCMLLRKKRGDKNDDEKAADPRAAPDGAAADGIGRMWKNRS